VQRWKRSAASPHGFNACAIFETFLEDGADVKATDDDDNQTLHCIALLGDLGPTKALLIAIFGGRLLSV